MSPCQLRPAHVAVAGQLAGAAGPALTMEMNARCLGNGVLVASIAFPFSQVFAILQETWRGVGVDSVLKMVSSVQPAWKSLPDLSPSTNFSLFCPKEAGSLLTTPEGGDDVGEAVKP